MVTEKNNFSSNAWHNFAKDKIISKYKNDKPWRKVKQIYSPPPFYKGEGGTNYAYIQLLSNWVCKHHSGMSLRVSLEKWNLEK